MLSAKADTTTVDAALALKANSADVYTISQTDVLLDAKAGIDDSSTTATMMTWSADKLNVDFNEKADASDVYTKTDVDTLLASRLRFPDFTTVLFNFDYTHTTFTATKSCWLVGVFIGGNGNSILSINGEAVGYTINESGNWCYNSVSIPLRAGDVVSATSINNNTNNSLRVVDML